MNNDWIYMDTSREYKERLREAEQERLARRIAAQQPRPQIVRTIMASLGRQMITLGERLEHGSRTPAHASARR